MNLHAFERDESGFTMVEMMVVIGILAVLGLIAIPTYLNQRKAAWNAAVQTDVSNAAIYIEQNKTKLGGYLDYAGGVPGLELSDGITLNVTGSDRMQKKTSCVEGWHTKSPADTIWSFNIIERKMKKGGCVIP